MNKHFIRIGNGWIRVPLVTIWFFFSFLGYVIKAWLPPRFGGHPNRSRLREAEFYWFPVDLWISAVNGQFVPKEKEG